MVGDGEVLAGGLRRREVPVQPGGDTARRRLVVAPQGGAEHREMPPAEIERVRLAVADEAAFGVDRGLGRITWAFAVHEVVEVLVAARLPVMVRGADPVKLALGAAPQAIPGVDVVRAEGGPVLEVTETEKGRDVAGLQGTGDGGAVAWPDALVALVVPSPFMSPTAAMPHVCRVPPAGPGAVSGSAVASGWESMYGEQERRAETPTRDWRSPGNHRRGEPSGPG